MLRITQIDSQNSHRILKLEGKLLEPWVPEVLRACSPHEGRLATTSLDLSALTFADQAGLKLLRELLDSGITVSACSGFVSALLQLEHS
jgi:ABC-type transporter Mla MlaB component